MKKHIKNPKARAYIEAMRVTTSKALFHTYYNLFINQFKDTPSCDFFVKFYGLEGIVSLPKKWANAWNLDGFTVHNLFSDRQMRDIKKFANKKKNLDQLLTILIKVSQSKYRDYHLRLHQMPSLRPTAAIWRVHTSHPLDAEIKKYDISLFDEQDKNIYQVTKFDGDTLLHFWLVHIVATEKRVCSKIDCLVICKICNQPDICIHMVCCNCPQYCRTGHCKHLHLVIMKVNNTLLENIESKQTKLLEEPSHSAIRDISAQICVEKTTIYSKLNSIKTYMDYGIGQSEVNMTEENLAYLKTIRELMAKIQPPNKMKKTMRNTSTQEKTMDEPVVKPKINDGLKDLRKKPGRKKGSVEYVDIGSLTSKKLTDALNKSCADQIWEYYAQLRWDQLKFMTQQWSKKELDRLSAKHKLAIAAWTCCICNEVKVKVASPMHELLACKGITTCLYLLSLVFFFMMV